LGIAVQLGRPVVPRRDHAVHIAIAHNAFVRLRQHG
jgi:hypothetical protein